MNKTTIWIIVLVVLAVLGFWYWSSSQTDLTATSETATNTTSASNTTTTSPNTFHSIFTQSGNHVCSYEQVGGTTSKGSSVIYIADGQMRGEFRTTTATGGTLADLMIYNGGYLYTWKEGATTGTKTSIKTLADLPAVIPTDLTSGSILGVSSENVSWDCHDWAKDSKQFVIPTYVKFTLK